MTEKENAEEWLVRKLAGQDIGGLAYDKSEAGRLSYLMTKDAEFRSRIEASVAARKAV